MKADIDLLVQTILRALEQYDSDDLAKQVRDGIGAGPLSVAEQARAAIQHYAEDEILSEEIRRYAEKRLLELPTF